MPAGPSTSASPDAARPEPRKESLRETIDSIVVAFILAFVFRAFVVEAFVIPTGSMAPTLYGRHGTMTCEFCGYSFAYGLLDPSSNSRVEHGPQSTATCPNCWRPNTGLRQNDVAGNSDPGDRILVLKWPLDFGGPRTATHRWDVTVFKDPSDGTTNFIKRCVGVPGEVLSIIRGDVYTVPIAELSDETRTIMEDRVQRKTELQYGNVRGRLESVPKAVLDELDRKLRIARKTPTAQSSLWFNVYNHDFRPRIPVATQPQWNHAGPGEATWDASARVVTFDGLGRPADAIELVNTMSVDAYAYNLKDRRDAQRRGSLHEFQQVNGDFNYLFYGENYVDDLRMRFVLDARGGGGALRLYLKKLDTRFCATLGMDGAVSISAERDGKPVRDFDRLQTRVAAFAGRGRGVEVSFEVVDYRVALSIDGEEVLASTPQMYAPDLAALRRGEWAPAAWPRIEADDAALSLLHLIVERDVYYLDRGRGALNELRSWLVDQAGWGTENNPIMLREGEYFMLGDNSPQSQDSRFWVKIGPHLQDRGERFQLGTVPEDQLIGRAFFVYWPSGHRLAEWVPGLIPDVGRMRWIR